MHKTHLPRLRRFKTKFSPLEGRDPHVERVRELETLIKTIKSDPTLSQKERIYRATRLRDKLNEEIHREYKAMHGM